MNLFEPLGSVVGRPIGGADGGALTTYVQEQKYGEMSLLKLTSVI
jgi:hypothetical protein